MPRRIVRKLLIIFVAFAGVNGVARNVLCQNDTLTFKVFVHSKGQTPEGDLLSENGYLTSDGKKVYRRGVAYSSVARAIEGLEKQLEGAVNILERKPMLEKKRRVGERVVAEFPDGVGGQKVLIISTFQKVLVSIEAPSLRHAHAFEKFNNR